MDSLVARHIELVELYKAKLEARNEQLLAVERAIDSLDDPGERLVMRLRYLDGRSWPNVFSHISGAG